MLNTNEQRPVVVAFVKEIHREARLYKKDLIIHNASINYKIICTAAILDFYYVMSTIE